MHIAGRRRSQQQPVRGVGSIRLLLLLLLHAPSAERRRCDVLLRTAFGSNAADSLLQACARVRGALTSIMPQLRRPSDRVDGIQAVQQRRPAGRLHHLYQSAPASCRCTARGLTDLKTRQIGVSVKSSDADVVATQSDIGQVFSSLHSACGVACSRLGTSLLFFNAND
jgi:hypothetical protein